MSAKKTYYPTTDGFISGTWRAKNEPVLMTEAEARYQVMIGNLSETKVEDAKPVKPAAKEETDGAGKSK